MYVDYDNYDDFEKFFTSLEGGFYSPGGVATVYGVTRQAVNKWINNDIIDAHRFSGLQGAYVIVPVSEFEKIDLYRSNR